MLQVDEALTCVLTHAHPQGSERVALAEACGRYLAEDVLADADLPPFDRAAMDGYAVRAEDVTHVPTTLALAGEIRAGQQSAAAPGPGEAVTIMTGARVPPTATALVPFEASTRLADGDRVEIRETAIVGQHIARRGSEAARGARVLSAGRRLDPAAIAVLASVGRSETAVGRRPAVSLIVTGDELVDADERPAGTQIRDANGPALAALVSETGAALRSQRRARDHGDALAAAIEDGLRADVLLISGGVSAGTTDLVRPTLERLGAEILFQAVAVKPGKPLVFGRRNQALIFGLPGNPVSAQVTFRLFVRPALLALQGARVAAGREIPVRVAAPLRNASGRRAYAPVRVRLDGTDLVAEPVASRGSADVFAHARADALLILEASRESVAAGELLYALALPAFLEPETRA